MFYEMDVKADIVKCKRRAGVLLTVFDSCFAKNKHDITAYKSWFLE